MPLRCAVQRCELSFIETLHDLVHREERIEQIAVPLDALLRDDGGALCDDETAFLQQTNMFCNRVAREMQLLRDSCFTRMYTATAPAGRSKSSSSFGTGKQFFARSQPIGGFVLLTYYHHPLCAARPIR